jgi:fructokinase
VNVGPVRFSGEGRTALAFVSLRADGDRESMFYRHPSADMLFEPPEVDAAAVQSAKVFHYFHDAQRAALLSNVCGLGVVQAFRHSSKVSSPAR